jgi:hypothetical protein
VKSAYVYLIAAVALAACSSPSFAPAGWQPDGATQHAWHRASGASLQTYTYTIESFSGMLPDLASQVAIDVVLQHRGAKLRSSNPLGPCPGAAGLATFSLPEARTLEEGFAVHDGNARRATYVRASAASDDPAVATAMQNLLC